MPLDEFEQAVDKVASPDRIMRWIVRIVLIVVLVGVAVSVAKVAIHWTSKVDAATTDHDWFVQQKEAIEAAKLEEKAAKDALERHVADVKERSGMLSWSRNDDREMTAALNIQILDTQKRRLSLIREYNSRAGQVPDPSYLEGLPKHIELTEGE